MKLGDFIQEYRECQNLSQRQFAEKCNLSNGYISMLEKGINPNTGEPVTPTLLNLKKLADGMNITIMNLLEIIDDMPLSISEQSNNSPTSPIQHIFDALNADGQRHLLDYAETLTYNPKYTRQQPKATQNDKPDIEAAKKRLAEIKYREDHAARIAAKGGNSTFPTTVYPTPEDEEAGAISRK